MAVQDARAWCSPVVRMLVVFAAQCHCRMHLAHAVLAWLLGLGSRPCCDYVLHYCLAVILTDLHLVSGQSPVQGLIAKVAMTAFADGGSADAAAAAAAVAAAAPAAAGHADGHESTVTAAAVVRHEWVDLHVVVHALHYAVC